MNSAETVKRPIEKVSEVVNKTKQILDYLRSAVLLQDDLTKDCCDSTVIELSKTVEGAKNACSKLDEEFKTVKEQVKSGELRLNEILEKVKRLQEENATLKENESNISSQNNIFYEHSKIAKELRGKLKAYKLISGTRFDLNDSDQTISGYVGINGDKPSNSTIIPFTIDKNNSNARQLLWEKIGEACSEISSAT